MQGNRFFIIFLGITAFFSITSACAAHDQNSTNLSHVPGQIVVEFTDDASNNYTLQSEVYNRVSAQTNISIQVLERSNVEEGLDLIEISDYNEVTETANLLEKQPEILFADPNFEIDLEKIPNDTNLFVG